MRGPATEVRAVAVFLAERQEGLHLSGVFWITTNWFYSNGTITAYPSQPAWETRRHDNRIY
jgi:hypothetical protein